MKNIHGKDPRIERGLFFEAASICEYETGGHIVSHNKSKRTRKKHIAAAMYRPIVAAFEHSDN